MTVEELIKELQTFPENLTVRFKDAEWGPTDITGVRAEEHEYEFVVIR